MDFIKEITNNSFLLIPNNIRDKVLDYIDKNKLLINTKIITFDELKKGLLFDYDNKTIHALMEKEGISYSLAKYYINNLYYIDKDNYSSDKLNKLLEMKNYLIESNLLIKDELFIDLLKSKEIIYVYGFDYITKFNKHLLNLAEPYINHKIIKKEQNKYEHVVHEAKTIEEEVLFVAEEISKLIKEGVNLDKIYITGIDDDYSFTLRRIFKAYNIPYFIKNENILYDTAIAKYFFNNLNNNAEELLKKISKKYNIENNESNNVIYNKLFNLVNKYYWADNINDVKDMMIEEAITTTLPSVHMEQEITLTNIYDNIFNDDEYVFMMNFNQGIYPKIVKDEEYIDDSIKPDFLEQTKDLNLTYKNTLIDIINNIKNLTITYKKHSLFNEYIPSYLVEDYFGKPEKISNMISSYSDIINKQLYAKKLDNLVKFKQDDEYLPVLSNTYTIDYNKYDNSFDGLDINMDNLRYSYSSMSNYFKCPFRYYCNNVLYLDEFSKNMNTFIGGLFHGVLDSCLGKDNDIDKVYDELIEENNNLPDDDKNKLILNNRDKYFLDKLREELHIIMDIINEQYSHIDHIDKESHEEPIEKTAKELNLNTKINAVIKGIVDKTIIIDNNVFVIDYKTGTSDKIDRKTFEYGLHIQLPIYMYLLETVNPELNVAGIYLQHILTGNNKKDKKMTQLEKRVDELKLDGLFNPDYIDKLGKDSIKAPTSKTRVYTNEDKNNIKDMIKHLIEECIDNTYDSKFDISPININDGTEDGCQYCNLKDVCYKRYYQYRYINTKQVEGDDNNE